MRKARIYNHQYTQKRRRFGGVLDRSAATCPAGVSERVGVVEETNQKRRRFGGVLDRSAATCPAGVSERVGV